MTNWNGLGRRRSCRPIISGRNSFLEERIICRMKYMSTEPDNAAYIVAACNAVPMLVEMVKYLSEEASGEVSCSGEWVIRTSEEVLQDAYQATEPKE